jgi:hypothetical protein
MADNKLIATELTPDPWQEFGSKTRELRSRSVDLALSSYLVDCGARTADKWLDFVLVISKNIRIAFLRRN